MRYLTSSVRMIIDLPDRTQVDLFGLEPKPVNEQTLQFLQNHPLMPFMTVEEIPQVYKKKYYPNCLQKDKPNKLLIVRYGGIGDILWVTPSIRAIKGQYPNTYIKMCVFEKDRELLYGNKYIDEIINTKFPKKEDIEWADYILDFFDSVENNKEAEVKDPVDISADWAGVKLVNPMPIYSVLEQEKNWAKMSLLANGYNDKKKIIGMPLTASSMNRTWQYYHELTEKIIKAYDVQILLLGNTGHSFPIVERIINTMPQNKNIINFVGKTTLRQCFAMLSLCDFVFTPDTGAVPFLASIGKPTIALYSTVPQSTRTKYYPNVVGIQSKTECAPCYKLHNCEKNSKCMSDITVYEVFEQIKKQIEG